MINVLDKNEHPPQFTSSEYFGQAFVGNSEFRIGPNTTLEKVVVRVQATDRDFGENARVFYSIESGKSIDSEILVSHFIGLIKNVYSLTPLIFRGKNYERNHVSFFYLIDK